MLDLMGSRNLGFNKMTFTGNNLFILGLMQENEVTSDVTVLALCSINDSSLTFAY